MRTWFKRMNVRGVERKIRIEYQGQFIDDKICGDGIMTWAHGARYSGGWEDGKFHEKGQYTINFRTDPHGRVGHWDKGKHKGWVDEQGYQEDLDFL